GMDLFGRVSAPAVVSADVRDTIPPPAPGNVAAELLGDATTGTGSWDAVTVGFDWTPTDAALAPDLDHLELHLRQGALESARASPATRCGPPPPTRTTGPSARWSCRPFPGRACGCCARRASPSWPRREPRPRSSPRWTFPSRWGSFASWR